MTTEIVKDELVTLPVSALRQMVLSANSFLFRQNLPYTSAHQYQRYIEFRVETPTQELDDVRLVVTYYEDMHRKWERVVTMAMIYHLVPVLTTLLSEKK